MKRYLSLDIGGTKVKYALMQADGHILSKNSLDTAHQKEKFLANLDQVIAENKKAKLEGIAFCAPGQILGTTIHFGGSLPFLDGLDLSHRYRQLGLPITVINDGKASALAEHWLGALKGIENCASITLGTGVGSGIIVNDRLLAGAHAQSGELSFMRLNQQSPTGAVFCGQACSAVRMIKRINQIVGNDDLTDGLAAFAAIKAGQFEAKLIFNQYCQNIVQLIENLQTVVDLEKIALGGGISAQPLLVKTVKLMYKAERDAYPQMRDTLTEPEIVAAQLKNDANLVGALAYLLQSKV